METTFKLRTHSGTWMSHPLPFRGPIHHLVYVHGGGWMILPWITNLAFSCNLHEEDEERLLQVNATERHRGRSTKPSRSFSKKKSIHEFFKLAAHLLPKNVLAAAVASSSAIHLQLGIWVKSKQDYLAEELRDFFGHMGCRFYPS
jgi:hypothetical protein